MTLLGPWLNRAIAALALGIGAFAYAGPPPVVGGPLLAEIAGMPAGQWKRVNANLYNAVWTPFDLRPLNGQSVSPPSKIILAWSSFAWDTRRGDIILYGGGHANYSGNDVYRWRAQSLAWERAALPSQITELFDSNGYTAIDGADAAPASAHTYDNNLYLPVVDRFLTLGGAMYNTGSAYLRPDEAIPGAVRKTGPYLFDPARADGDKVGGTTGSHVQRVGPFPGIVGGNMWQNRDLTRNRPTDPLPTKHVSGCTAYTEEGGFDVVYIGATGGSGTNLDLFRYVLRDVANPTTDSMEKVGRFYIGTAGQTACGYDAARKLFVRTGNDGIPFVFWSLLAPGPANSDARVEVNASISAFNDWLTANGKRVIQCGLDFDPGDASFVVWCGGPQVWRLRPPPTNVTAGWTIDPEPVAGSPPPLVVAYCVCGKWKYVPGYDVFIAVEGIDDGNVWIYKPLGWAAPQAGDFVNWAPDATLTSPAAGTTFDVGASVALAANANDGDGTVSRVEFLVNGKTIASDASPAYAGTWTPQAAGSYALSARAVDNLGGEGLSATVAVTVLPPNVPPSVSVTAPASGSNVTIGTPVTVSANAGDSDGTVAKVEFLANAVKFDEDATAAYSVTWTPAHTGSVVLTARATDNRNGVTTSAAVTVNVLPPNSPPTASLTSPSSGANYSLGAVVPLAATASDPGGSVAKVEFYANAQKVGEDASAPYSLGWTPSAAGNYTITARAIDNLGATGTSAGVAITVTDTTQTIVLQQGAAGYLGTIDTQLSSYAPTGNYGSAGSLANYAQNYASLFRFAVFAAEGGPVPDTATIVSATLEIYKTQYNYVYRLHPLLKQWDEAQATWNLARTGSTWSVAGAKGVGTDYATAFDAEFAAPWDPGWMTFDVTARLRLIGQGAANYGWRVVPVSGYNGTRWFYSSEYSDPALRPRLTIRYALP